MDRTEQTVRHMLSAIEAPLYDVGVLSSRGMLPGLDAIPSSAVLERLPLLKYRNSRGSHIYLRRNFQAWLKQTAVLPKRLGTFAAQTLAARYGAVQAQPTGDASADCPASPTANRSTASPTACSLSFGCAPTPGNSSRRLRRSLKKSRQRMKPENVSASDGPRRVRFLPAGDRGHCPSLERFRTSPKFVDRPAAADIAFCVAAYASGMEETRMEQALEDDYLSRDPSSSERAAYIRRTMNKARDWIMAGGLGSTFPCRTSHTVEQPPPSS